MIPGLEDERRGQQSQPLPALPTSQPLPPLPISPPPLATPPLAGAARLDMLLGKTGVYIFLKKSPPLFENIFTPEVRYVCGSQQKWEKISKRMEKNFYFSPPIYQKVFFKLYTIIQGYLD